jgi:hypothetical protein
MISVITVISTWNKNAVLATSSAAFLAWAI